MSGTGGTSCIVRYCSSNTKAKKTTFFRIRKDPKIAKLWLIASHREDLLNKSLDDLYKNYKICANHFDENMYTSPERNRLLPLALPTIFPQLERGTSISSEKRTQNYEFVDCASTPSKKFKIISDITLTEPTILEPLIQIETSDTSTSPLSSPVASQTKL